jgi:hypothetical protein
MKFQVLNLIRMEYSVYSTKTQRTKMMMIMPVILAWVLVFAAVVVIAATITSIQNASAISDPDANRHQTIGDLSIRSGAYIHEFGGPPNR